MLRDGSERTITRAAEVLICDVSRLMTDGSIVVALVDLHAKNELTDAELVGVVMALQAGRQTRQDIAQGLAAQVLQNGGGLADRDTVSLELVQAAFALAKSRPTELAEWLEANQSTF